MPEIRPKTTAEKFSSERMAWSEIKHKILSDYLSLLLGKVGLGGRLYYVDGFAGAGRLGDGSKGSPLYAAEIAAHPRQKSRIGVLKCINVEKNPKLFANLAKETAAFVADGLVTNLQGRFGEHLDSILDKLRDSPAIFFIDPFGTENADLSTIKRISSRPGKTEALIRYDDSRVKRVYSWGQTYKGDPNDRPRKTAAKMMGRASLLTDKAGLRSLSTNDGGWRNKTVQGYCDAVKAQRLFRFALAYPVLNPTTKKHKYFLVHLCNHPDGYHYMANFMARVERSRAQLSQGGTLQLFNPTPNQLEIMPIIKDVDTQVEQKVARRVAEVVQDLARKQKWTGQKIENREIYAAIVDQMQCTATRKEWIGGLRLLNAQGVVGFKSADDGSYTLFR